MRDFAKFHDRDMLASASRAGGLALLAGVVLALIRPFGSDEWDIFARLGFWTSMSAAWFVTTFAIAELLDRSPLASRLDRGTGWVLTFVASLIPMGALSALALHAMGRWSPTPEAALEVLWYTMLIGLMLEGAKIALSRRSEAAVVKDLPAENGRDKDVPVETAPPTFPAPNTHAEEAAYPPLLKRLPPPARGPILCLQMEDHYVRIHTQANSSLILMRFSDAISEVSENDGLRVHRSWWVANEAIRSVKRKGRTAQIELSNALKVPVSQPYLEAVTAIAEQRQLQTDEY